VASSDDQEDWKPGGSFSGSIDVLVSKQPALKAMGSRAGTPAKMVTGVALVQQHEPVPGGRSALVPDRQNLSGCSNTHGVAKAGETDRLTLDTDKSSPDKRAFSRPSSRVRTGKDRRMECNVCPTEPVLPGRTKPQ
jgi:hypothetical protein